MLLSYAIQLSQPVNLELYKLKNGYTNNPVELLADSDPEALEEFLDGDPIGYLAGIRMTDNVTEDPAQGDGYYKYVDIANDVFCERIVDHINSATELTVMKEILAYGFDGEPLIVQRPAKVQGLMAAAPDNEFEPSDEDAVQPEETPSISEDYEPIAEESVPADTTDDAVIDAEETNPGSEAIMDSGDSDEPAAIAEGIVTADGEQFEEAVQPEDISDETEPEAFVPADEENSLLLAANTNALPQDEGKIQNYLIWNGMLADEDGNPIEYDYSDGYYIVVLTPTTEETKKHNSFLAFSVSTTSKPNELLAEEYPGLYFEFPGDPVNLLTGSFSWNYTDISLYGKYDLPFTRYYESMDADQNHGLGYGWSTDYSIDLEVDTLYAKVTLPRGKSIYFDYYYDGTYRSQSGSAFTFSSIGGGYRLAHQDGTVYLFDADSHIRSVSTLDGNVVTYTYNGDKLASVSNNSGTLNFAYNGDGNISRVTDSVGRTAILEYNGDYLTSVTNADAQSLHFDYDSDGLLTEIVNYNGEAYLTNQYDASKRVVRQHIQDEGTFVFTYDAANRTNTCTGDNGYYLSIVYDDLRRIVQSTNTDGTQYITYNKLNQRTSETDREGNTTSYSYDENGNVSEVTYSDGFTESYSYNSSNQVTRFVDRGGNATVYTYDGSGNLTSLKYARGNTTYYSYDDNRNVTAYTDALGNTATYTYDRAGNRTSQTDAAGNQTSFTYDDQGRLISATDAAGSVTRYEYTDAGKLVKTINANGDEMTYTVDGNGFNLTESDWLGNITSYTYDTQNNVTSVTDPLGNRTSYAYDTSGNLTVSTDANGHTVSYGYDAEGRMISMTNAAGKTWKYQYDKNSNLVTTTNPLGGKLTFTYDAVQRQTSVTDENGGKTSYSYDAVGNLIAEKDALGHTAKYAYDAHGNLVSVTDRLGDQTTYIFGSVPNSV